MADSESVHIAEDLLLVLSSSEADNTVSRTGSAGVAVSEELATDKSSLIDGVWRSLNKKKKYRTSLVYLMFN